MSVAYQSNKIPYTCNGATQDFPIPFELQDATHLKIYLRNNSVTPVTETLLSEGAFADYQLTGANPALGIVATGIHTTVAYPVGRMLIMTRALPLSQSASYVDSAPPPAKSYEVLGDKLTMIAQQLQEQITRSIKFAKTSPTVGFDLPEPAANKFWGYDGAAAIKLFTAGEMGILINQNILAKGFAAFVDDASFLTNKGTSATPGDAYYNTTYDRIRIYRSSGWEFLLQPQLTGSRGTPTAIVAGTGIAGAFYAHESIVFVNTASGQVTVTANPQIAAGQYVGQIMKIVGTSDTNYPTFSDGTGLALNGAWDGQNNSVLALVWDGSNWVEEYRR